MQHVPELDSTSSAENVARASARIGDHFDHNPLGGSDTKWIVLHTEEAGREEVGSKPPHLNCHNPFCRGRIVRDGPDMPKYPPDECWSYRGSVGLGYPDKRDGAGASARDKGYPDSPCLSVHNTTVRVARRIADCLGTVAGGLATVVILNFNQSRAGKCPAVEDDSRWPAVLPLLAFPPQPLRCPSPPVYRTAIALYSASALFHITREPKYWADCALAAVLGSTIVGAFYGLPSMLDALILGGFLSLVCCKAIAWSAGRADQIFSMQRLN